MVLGQLLMTFFVYDRQKKIVEFMLMLDARQEATDTKIDKLYASIGDIDAEIKHLSGSIKDLIQQIDTKKTERVNNWENIKAAFSRNGLINE